MTHNHDGIVRSGLTMMTVQFLFVQSVSMHRLHRFWWIFCPTKTNKHKGNLCRKVSKTMKGFMCQQKMDKDDARIKLLFCPTERSCETPYHICADCFRNNAPKELVDVMYHKKDHAESQIGPSGTLRPLEVGAIDASLMGSLDITTIKKTYCPECHIRLSSNNNELWSYHKGYRILGTYKYKCFSCGKIIDHVDTE